MHHQHNDDQEFVQEEGDVFRELEDEGAAEKSRTRIALVSMLGVMSFFASLAVLVVCLCKSLSLEMEMSNYFVINIAAADCISSIGFALSAITPRDFGDRKDVSPAKQGSVCRTQGLMIQLFLLATFLWTGCYAHFMYRTVVSKLRNEKTFQRPRRLLWLYGLLSWGISIAVSLVCNAMGVYGPTKDTGWCWIKEEFNLLRVLVFYVPLPLAIISSVVAVTLAFKQIKERKEEEREGSNSRAGCTPRANRQFERTGREAAAYAHETFGINVSEPIFGVRSNKNGMETQVGIPVVGREVETFSSDDEGIAMTIKKAELVGMEISPFVLVFVVAWSFATVNRYYTVATGESSPFLAVLETLCAPLHGTLNAAVFMMMVKIDNPKAKRKPFERKEQITINTESSGIKLRSEETDTNQESSISTGSSNFVSRITTPESKSEETKQKRPIAKTKTQITISCNTDSNGIKSKGVKVDENHGTSTCSSNSMNGASTTTGSQSQEKTNSWSSSWLNKLKTMLVPICLLYLTCVRGLLPLVEQEVTKDVGMFAMTAIRSYIGAIACLTIIWINRLNAAQSELATSALESPSWTTVWMKAAKSFDPSSLTVGFTCRMAIFSILQSQTPVLMIAFGDVFVASTILSVIIGLNPIITMLLKFFLLANPKPESDETGENDAPRKRKKTQSSPNETITAENLRNDPIVIIARFLGFILAVAGVAIIALPDITTSGGKTVDITSGIVIALLTALMWSVASIFNRLVCSDTTPIVKAFFSNLIGGSFSLVAGGLVSVQDLVPFTVTLSGAAIGYLLYLGIFTSALSMNAMLLLYDKIGYDFFVSNKSIAFAIFYFILFVAVRRMRKLCGTSYQWYR